MGTVADTMQQIKSAYKDLSREENNGKSIDD